jgi:hypothetical protein
MCIYPLLDGSFTYNALLQDRVAINAIRIRVLLDDARNRLAELCGYADWDSLEFNVPKESRYDVVHRFLNTLKDLDVNWKAIGRQPDVLKVLLEPNTLRCHGNVAAHTSSKESIANSILAIQGKWERATVTTIFRAMYGVEPEASF